MNLVYKIIRAIIVIAIALVVTLTATLYVGLSLPPVQNRIAGIAERELSSRLSADVSIGSLTITPFNRLMLRDIAVIGNSPQDTLMTIERLGAGINIYELTTNRHIVINYVELIRLDATVSRDSLGGELNIQPIIDRLKSTSSDNKKNVNLAVNTVIIRNCSMRYDVENQPHPPTNIFSPHHIDLYDFSADLRLPAVGTDSMAIDVKRFRLKEASGLEITDLSGKFSLTPNMVAWSDIALQLPGSQLLFIDNTIPNPDHLPLDKLITESHVDLGVALGSYFTPADLAPLANKLADVNEQIDLTASLSGIVSKTTKLNLHASAPHQEDLNISLNCHIVNPLDSTQAAINNLTLRLHANSPFIARALVPNENLLHIINQASFIDVTASGSLNQLNGNVVANITTACGEIAANGNIYALNTTSPKFNATIDANDLQLGNLLRRNDLGSVSASITSNGRIKGKNINGDSKLEIERFDLNGYPLSNITALLSTQGKEYDLHLTSGDPAALLTLRASGILDHSEHSVNFTSTIKHVDLAKLLPNSKISKYSAQATAHADLRWDIIDNILGRVNIQDIKLDTNDGKALHFNGINLSATTLDEGKRLFDLQSDIISGDIQGDIYLTTIAKQISEMAFESLPALAPTATPIPLSTRSNNFTYRFTIHDTEPWAEALKLPISNLGQSHINGSVNYNIGSMNFNLDAPFLRQGNKLIEGTALQAFVDGQSLLSKLYFTTRYPTKHGPLSLYLDTNAINDHVATDISWNIDRAARYDGNISLSAKLNDTPAGKGAQITLNPGTLTFNDSTWTVNRATIDVAPSLIVIDGINAYRSGQFVKIDGRASQLSDDAITIDLLGVNLDYIFESLGIDKVMLGGDATGSFQASNIFSPEPRIVTEGLHVKDISYNKVILGDALIKSHWDQEQRAITLDATIDQDNGKQSFIDGAIFPLNDSIDINFDTHSVNVAFMHNYMKAFASEVSGRASGKLRLWGNFKYIDAEGDIAAENLKIKIAFTNTAYFTNDTVRLRLGEITIPDVTIRDMFGNSAQLEGKVWHKFFKEPSFDMKVSNAQNLLVYDESATMNPDWYGRIFGNGRAHINGKPGVVNINVGMTTAPGSTFTFVLNNMEEANDYSFITFRDRDLLALGENETLIDDTPSTVRRLREMLAKREIEEASAYNIDLQMDINPSAQINLVMDPVGGDRIRSRGNGNLRMLYQSADNDLHMYGTYTLEQGNYNFTLQDIIIKDFSIKAGSSISFTGDPFAAILDIKAAYSLTANLSDLDESFLQDKDLNRTTVPVNAILKVTGALQQPEIGFDLEFPTLTQDTYRKVRSIVSTEDMMNRQIIYLLALSRFYTPDYMASTTRGNELFSVASSTISSQLGNILGNISDNWNIAPTFRSDRGDFSDVEVDVALSSSLLNNRLLFNGNFGYRDKSLNNTQFVGDFDIEYLLNRPGTLRLKAYNRYNDMNYYVRTAETTQGVGISFRRNFDNFYELLHNYLKRDHRDKQPQPDTPSNNADTVKTVPAKIAPVPHPQP